MKNPWLEIPLSDYEGHMALPEVGQATLLADIFADLLNRYQPNSVAVLGCAGGNGFERIPTTTRVVAIDLNQSYMDQLAERFCRRIQRLELIVGDVQTDELRFSPVDLVYAGLIFEYVDVEIVLARLSSLVRPGGILGTVVQLEDSSIQKVTPSPFRSLENLSSFMKTVTPSQLRHLAEQHRFREVRSRFENASGGKVLAVQEFSQSIATNPRNEAGLI